MDESEVLELITDTLTDRNIETEISEDRSHAIITIDGTSYIVRVEETQG